MSIASSPSDLLQQLTSAQLEAVRHVQGPLLILAGPGSGKTRVITHRIGNLLSEGISATQILGLTFTNKAAEEVRSRVLQMAPGEKVWTSTFHRFCSRLLRQYAPLVGLEANFVIYDTQDSRRVLKRVIEHQFGQLRFVTPERIAAAVSWAKNNLITADSYQARGQSSVGEVVKDVYPAYQARLAASNAVDFDDLLLHVAMLLRDNPEVRETLDERFRYVMVDEYQDTNLAQYAIVRALSINHPNLAVTGDPDQSIYGWRGANLRNILDFEVDYPDVKIVRLEQNYRSTPRILRAADSLISYNKQRKPKRLLTDNADGPPVRYVQYATERDEATGVIERIAEAVHQGRRRPRDFAVFYRVNALSRPLEDALHEHGIPFQMVNGVEFFSRAEVKDLLSYLKLLNNPRDDEAFLRVVNTPTRGIGKTTQGRLQEYAARHALSLLDAARTSGTIDSLAMRTATKVAGFVAMLDRLGVHAHAPVEEIIGHVLSETQYEQQYQESESEQDQQRLSNIQELLTAARQFDERHPGSGHLEEFLEETSLVNDTDAWEEEDDQVTLMTLHAAKGLEFPVVFIVALEEGLIPHERAGDKPDGLEEERRLLFVGMTRAEQELHLSGVGRRTFRGQTKTGIPSSFLQELPREEMDWHQLAASSAPDFPSQAMPNRPPQPVEPGLFTTADQLVEPFTDLDGVDEPAIDPETFYHGMVVTHDEYGLGKVVALSGEGPRRMATVLFATGAGEKKFILQHSNLKPARQ